jgi:hypothetical protein
MAEPASEHAADRATSYPKAASCSCGRFTATVAAPPKFTHTCSCLDCQRGTGSAFSYSAFFAEGVVQVAGESRSYRRTSDSGRWLETSFCPICGVGVLTRLEALPGIIGISVGCFADPNFDKPEKFWWASRRHHWLDTPSGVEPIETQ